MMQVIFVGFPVERNELAQAQVRPFRGFDIDSTL